MAAMLLGQPLLSKSVTEVRAPVQRPIGALSRFPLYGPEVGQEYHYGRVGRGLQIVEKIVWMIFGR